MAPETILLSDLRGTVGFLLSVSIFIFLGVFNKNWIRFSLIISDIVYLSYGTSRLVRIVVDGWPGNSFAIVIILEFIMGICALAILNNNKSKTSL